MPRRIGFTLFGVLLFALLLAGCGGGRAQLAEELALSIEQTSTAVAASEVSAAAALATAQAQATAVAQGLEATRGAEAALSSEQAAATATAAAPIVAELPTYGVDPSEGELAWIHPPVSMEVEEYLETDYANQYLARLVSDFVISADITWNTQFGLTGCGFVLRSDGDEESFNQYLAIITRGGNGSIAFIKQARGTFFNVQLEKVGSRDPSFQWHNDTTNRLTVVARGDTFSVYTNGNLVQQFTATEYDRGFVAMVVLSESGRTACEFNNAWLWVLDKQ